MNIKKIILALTVALSSTIAYSQKSRTIGISASIQESQFGIMLPIWLDDRLVLAPAFEIKSVENVGADYAFALIPRYYFKKDQIMPYLGLRAGAILNVPSIKNKIDTKTKLDIVTGLAFGAEYFLHEKFSLGVELQGNFSLSDEYSYRFGNPDGLNFNTGSMVTATVYF